MWQCEARLLYEAKRRALGTRYMVIFFFQFVSSPIVWFLAVKQNLSEPKLNLLLLCSRGRRILKEGRVKRLLPQSWSGRIMNRKGSSWHDRVLTQLHTSVKYRRTIATKCRRKVGEVSVKYRWTKSYIGRDTSGTTIDRVSTECRPTIVGVSTDHRPTIDCYIDGVSTAYQPTIDRLSTECRPTIDRYIDR